MLLRKKDETNQEHEAVQLRRGLSIQIASIEPLKLLTTKALHHEVEKVSGALKRKLSPSSVFSRILLRTAEGKGARLDHFGMHCSHYDHLIVVFLALLFFRSQAASVLRPFFVRYTRFIYLSLHFRSFSRALVTQTKRVTKTELVTCVGDFKTRRCGSFLSQRRGR